LISHCITDLKGYQTQRMKCNNEFDDHRLSTYVNEKVLLSIQQINWQQFRNFVVSSIVDHDSQLKSVLIPISDFVAALSCPISVTSPCCSSQFSPESGMGHCYMTQQCVHRGVLHDAHNQAVQLLHECLLP